MSKKPMPEPAPDTLHLRSLGEKVKKLGPERITILWHLCRGTRTVGEIARILDISDGAASAHLAKLYADGLVGQRRNPDKKQEKWYWANGDAIMELLDGICGVFGFNAPTGR